MAQAYEPRHARHLLHTLSRRRLLTTSAGVAAGALMPSAFPSFAFAVGVEDKPPIGTWPDGSKGDTVNVAAAVPRTGAYAVQGRVAMHISRIDGSYSGIMGLPLRETALLLKAAGIRL